MSKFKEIFEKIEGSKLYSFFVFCLYLFAFGGSIGCLFHNGFKLWGVALSLAAIVCLPVFIKATKNLD